MGTSWAILSSLLAALSIGCGRTELGRDFLLGQGGLGGDTSGGLGGPGPSAGGGTFGTFGATSGGDSGAVFGGPPSIGDVGSTVAGTVAGSDASSSTSASSASATSSSSGGETTGAGGTAGAGGDCFEDDCSRSWSEPVLLETDAKRDVRGPQIAMNDAGDAAVAWTQSTDDASQVRATLYTPEAGWGGAELVWSESGWLQVPRVAIDADGLAMVIWDRNAEAPVRGSTHGPAEVAGEWEPAEVVSGNEDSRGYEPELAMDAGGSAVVVWSEVVDTSDGNANELWSNVWMQGGGWGSTERIAPDLGTQAPAVAMNGSGSAFVVWKQEADPIATWFGHIWSSRSEGGGDWSAPELLQSVVDEAAYDPQVAIDAEGNAIVVWGQQTVEGQDQVWANRFTAGVGWGNAEMVDTGPLDAIRPLVGIDGDGNAIIIWGGHETTVVWEIWANRYTADSGWGAPERISSADSSNQHALAVGSAGDAVAVWTQSVDGHPTLWSNRYVPGVSWGEPELVDRSQLGASDEPDVAIDGAGNAMAVWSRRENDVWNAWVSSSSRPE